MTDIKTMSLDDLLSAYRDTREEIHFESFINRMRRMLYRYFRMKGAKLEHLEEAFQQASLDLFLRVDQFDAAKGDARRYFQHIVKYNLIRRWKSQYRTKNGVRICKEIRFADMTPVYREAERFDESVLASPVPDDPTDEIERRQAIRLAVREALETLNSRQREAAEFIMNAPVLESGQLLADKYGISRQAAHVLRQTIRDRFENVGSIRIVSRLDAMHTEPAKRRESTKPTAPIRLTPKQREIVLLVGQGLSVNDVSRRLGLSYHAVYGRWITALEKIKASPELQALTGISV